MIRILFTEALEIFYFQKKFHRHVKNHLQDVRDFIVHQNFIYLFHNACILCILRISVGTFMVGRELDALRSFSVTFTVTFRGKCFNNDDHFWSDVVASGTPSSAGVFAYVIYGDVSLCAHRFAGCWTAPWRTFRILLQRP